MSAALPAALQRPAAIVRVFDEAEELRGTAQRIVVAFIAKHGTVAPITREFADAFLFCDRGHGLTTDEAALEMFGALEQEINELEAIEDDEAECENSRVPYPVVADECEWLSDEGWQQLADAAVAAE